MPLGAGQVPPLMRLGGCDVFLSIAHVYIIVNTCINTQTLNFCAFPGSHLTTVLTSGNIVVRIQINIAKGV